MPLMSLLRIPVTSAVALIGALLPAQVSPSWIAAYNGGDVDFGYKHVIDASGNVYVGGQTYVGANHDLLLVKYNNAGVRQWTRTYNGPAQRWEEFSDLEIDDQGNLYLLGSSDAANGIKDWVIIKYDTSGFPIWVRRYDGPAGAADLARDLAIAPDGSLYVTGYSYRGPASMGDFHTIKYDSSGSLIWERSFSSPGAAQDQVRRVEVDSSGNAILIGEYHTGGATYRDWATVKYSAGGTLLWSRIERLANINALDTPHDLTLDIQGNIYVTGEGTAPDGYPDAMTVKYSPSGDVVWKHVYNGPPSGYDHGFRILLDQYGHALVMVESDQGPPTYYDFVVLEYSPAGALLRTLRYPIAGSLQQIPADITLDDFGNLYLTGGSHNPVGGSDNWEFVTARFDPSWNRVWESRWNPTNGIDFPSVVGVDPFNNVVVTGTATWDAATLMYRQRPTVHPETYQVLQGIFVSGDVVSLRARDQVYLVCGVQAPLDTLVIEFSGTTTPGPLNNLAVRVDTRVSVASQVAEVVEAYNFTTGAFESVGSRILTMSDTTEVWILSNPAAYIGPTGAVRLRLRYQTVSRATRAAWSIYLDRVAWSGY
jgi:hypothetical protein